MAAVQATNTELTTVPAAVARAAATSDGGAFFGLSGSGNFHLTHELRDAGLSYYGVTHESACVAAADGYARASGQIGIATVHQGPGLTNAVTALREAVRSHTPLVLFAADVPRGKSLHNQYIDQRALVASTGAAVEFVTEASAAYRQTIRSFLRAQLEQRPVVVLLPIDVQAESVCLSQVEPARGQLPRPPCPHPSAIRDALALLRDAERPIILAGRGAATSHAREPLIKLAELLGAPLLTSSQAHGLFRGHPHSMGIAGGFGTQRARDTLRSADVVLVFGCSLNSWTLAQNEDLSEHAQIIQVDTSSAAFNTDLLADIGIHADCALAGQAFVRELSYRSPPASSWHADQPPSPEARSSHQPGDRITPQHLTDLLESLLPEQRTISIDSGHFMIFPASTMQPPDPQGYILAQAFMSMGLALAEGLGACVARPERPAVVTVGDGGAKMSICEIDTAVSYSLPVLVVVYNDAAYGAEVHDLGPTGRALDTVQFADIDFVSVAGGFGAPGCTVRQAADLAPVEQWLANPTGPFIVDAKIDPAVRGPWVE